MKKTTLLRPQTTTRSETQTPQVFIGFDERQSISFEVCKKSILDNASGPVDIYALDHRDLRRKGLFYREWLTDQRTGNYVDASDNLSFSNQFSHTRFLVPSYSTYLGIRENLALFVDTDFVFFGDIYSLFGHCRRDKPVSVVKHDYCPENTLKMDQQVQTRYPKKLWSSLMMFNLYDSRLARWLPLEYVNTAKTSDLHRFSWVESDSNIGSIDESWNFIPDHSENNTNEINAIHYTEGLPDLAGFETSKYAKYYLDIKRSLLK